MTRDGLDPLLPESENTAEIIGLPTEEEMNSAITKNIGHVLAVVSFHLFCYIRLDTELTGRD